MKRVVIILFLFLGLSSFVFAGSEIGSTFMVSEEVAVVDYHPPFTYYFYNFFCAIGIAIVIFLLLKFVRPSKMKTFGRKSRKKVKRNKKK